MMVCTDTMIETPEMQAISFFVSPGCVVKDMGGVGLIVDLRAQTVHDHIVDLDQNGLFILNLLDGNRSLGEVARLFKQTRGIEADAALREVTDFCLMMYRSRMLRITPDQQNERCGRSEAPPVRFVQNPEAILAAEGENGGILFLPTTGFRVLNEIGLFIWNMCDGSRCTDDLVREVLSKYDGATGAKVKNDVQGFIDDLMSNFFLWVECAVNG